MCALFLFPFFRSRDTIVCMIESGRARPQQRNSPKPKHRFQFNQFSSYSISSKAKFNIDWPSSICNVYSNTRSSDPHIFLSSNDRCLRYQGISLLYVWIESKMAPHSISLFINTINRLAAFSSFWRLMFVSKSIFALFFFVDRCVHKLVHIRQRNMCVIFFILNGSQCFCVLASDSRVW